jgi:hypothetical protein
MALNWFGRFVVLALLLVLGAAGSARAAKEEPLVNKVRDAIDRGVQYLRDIEKGNGHWEVDGMNSQGRRGGWTSLALLALLNAGVKPDDPIIDRGLKFLRTIPPESTYVVGLQTMVFAAAGRNEDRERIQRNADWLIEAAFDRRGGFAGWSYGKKNGFGGNGDNSNTQYALLGLHEAHLAGAKIDRKYWKAIRDYYVQTQRPDGGWGYAPHFNNGSTLTMTTAGLCGLLIASAELNSSREVMQPTGAALHCGRYEEDKPAQDALRWIGGRFNVRYPQAIYYNLYGLERAGRLTGLRYLGFHDWYREGCEFLVGQQTPDGFWLPNGGHDAFRVVATSFALLFLSKGRTPILVSKLVHGPGEDWNNDHNDARYLVEFSSRELFKRMPLAWQIFDAKRRLINNNREEQLELVKDLMQSPIAYFNGHKVPQFTDAEKAVLKEYVEQGGFILAEACCGQQAFDAGFRLLMKDLFPDNPLKPLPPEHPLWRAHALVKAPEAGGEFPLEGIEMGCKTVVVYSPKDLSCYWESNKFAKSKGPAEGDKAQLAFRLGANIVAYATGMEPPKPRLSPVDVVRDDPVGVKIPRGYLKVVQLRHDGDWQPAPKAMRNLMAQLQDKARLLVSLKTEAAHPSSREILEYKFLYMHGRNSFVYNDAALVNLRADLQTGGLLLADACCGKKAFDTSFREFMTKLFPEKKLEPIPLDDVLFSQELNGHSISTVRCRRERPDGGPEAELREVPPLLEGIKINNRWVVIYSKYDLGCALEKHKSSDCLGHDFESAIRLGSAVVLYALKR